MTAPLSHLDLLEAESIHIFREAAAQFRRAGAAVFDRQGLDRPAASGAQGVLSGQAAVSAAARRHDLEVPRHDRLPRPHRARARPRADRAHQSRGRGARHQSDRLPALHLHRRHEDAGAAPGARRPRASMRRSAARGATRRPRAPRSGCSRSARRATAGTRAGSGRRCGGCSTGGWGPARRCACSRCRIGPRRTCGATSPASGSTWSRSTSPPSGRRSCATAACWCSTTTGCRCDRARACGSAASASARSAAGR